MEILNSKDGYVVWHADTDYDFGFEIIHQNKCDDNSKSMSLPLDDFIGDRGLNELLSFLSHGMIKRYQGQTSGLANRIKDFDEFVDFFRRLQFPNYESARVHFRNIELLDDFKDENEISPYLEDGLAKIISKYSK